MGFRFRKSISILPGVRINLSKGGISASLGRSGATVNLSRRGVRGTVGLPGTGLSYSDDIVRAGKQKSGKQMSNYVGPSGDGRPATGVIGGLLRKFFGENGR